jgi:hypothetical protein
MGVKKYEVAIRATVTQSFVVEAPDEYEAKLYAHEAFDIAQPQSFEQYSEEVLWLTEVKDG